MPQKEMTEFLYTSNQIVCVKHDKGYPENTLVLACLQENVKVRIKKVMAGIPWYFGQKYEQWKVFRNENQTINLKCKRTEIKYFAKIAQNL